MLQLIARAGGIMPVLAQAGVHPDHNVRLVPEVQLAVTGGKTWKRTDLLMMYDIPEAPYAAGGVQAVAPSRQRRSAPRPPPAPAPPPQPPARAAGDRVAATQARAVIAARVAAAARPARPTPP